MILEKHNPGACDTGAKMDFEELKLPYTYTPENYLGAIYFWNYESQSVEPLRVKCGGISL